MKKRRPLSAKKSKKNFKRGAKVKKRNYSPGSMRGGIRL